MFDFQSYDSYGAPLAPPAPPYDSGYNPSYNPGYDQNYPNYGNQANNPTYNPNNPYYVGYGSDMELTMRLGQIALICFIILTIFIMAYLMLKCCLECRKMNDTKPLPYAKSAVKPR